MTKFTAHNIILDNGIQTLPGQKPIAESPSWQSINSLLSIFDLKDAITGVDLGCLEGAYSVELAKMGLLTLGIEARMANFEKCVYIKNTLGLKNLEFARDDVRNVAHYGKFDITLCRGLLYHLNDPVNFISLMGRVTKKLLILHTHFAPESDWRYNSIYSRLINKASKYLNWARLVPRINWALSSLTTNEGLKGRWYKEWKATESKNKIESKLVWAAYNNHRSFWLTKDSLSMALKKARFRHVFEYHVPEDTGRPENYRTMMVGLK